MFIDNRYTHIYHSVIQNATAKNRTKGSIYYERHHIIPKSLGGNSEKSNLVLLTPKEHYICHRLLVKMLEGKNKAKMFTALMFLQGKHKSLNLSYIGPNAYSNARNACRLPKELHPKYGKPVSEENRERMRSLTGEKALMYGKKHSEETKAKMSASHKGKNLGADNPMFGRRMSIEEKMRHSEVCIRGEHHHWYGKGYIKPDGSRISGKDHGMYGKKHTEETRRKISEAVAGKQSGEKNHQYGVERTAEQKAEQSQKMMGRKWLNNGTDQRFVNCDLADLLTKEGWIRGKIR